MRFPPEGATDRQLAVRLAREYRLESRGAARADRAAARASARQRRRWRTARRRLPGQLAVSAVSGSAFAVGFGDTWAVVSAGAALLAARSLTRLRRPQQLADLDRLTSHTYAPAPGWAVPAAPRIAPPPPPGSVAFPAVRRLAAARSSLLRLLPLVAPAGRDAAQDAAQVAATSDRALRWQAARLAAVEPHRGADPDLVRLLDQGVAAQESLVAALADLVSASADPHASARLQEATDALHGLAAGLRAVRPGG